MKAEYQARFAGCFRFDSELEAYLEGEPRPFVAGHAQSCPLCGALLADLELVRQAARELTLEEPSPVVWANVRARLEAEGAFRPRKSAWWNPLAWRSFPHAVPVGVLAGLVIFGALLTMPPKDTEEVATTSRAAVYDPARAKEDGALANLVAELESNYQANHASLSPGLRATYEKSLYSLNDSIRECLDSLRHEPRNTLAHDYLLTAYTRKAEILASALEFEGR